MYKLFAEINVLLDFTKKKPWEFKAHVVLVGECGGMFGVP